MKIEFLAPSNRDPDNRWADSARLINWYREPTGERTVLNSVLGTESFADLDGVFCRAAGVVDGVLYIAHGGKLFKVESDATVTSLGTITDSAETTISGNNGKVTVAAGGNYYVWDGTTLSTPAAGAFSDFGSVTFFGQLTVLTERNGRRVQWSDVADPTTLNGLNFATTESRDDDNLRVLPVSGALWFFKQSSIERWYQDGADIKALPGSTIEKGLKDYNLLTAIPDGCFFVANDNKAYLVRGGALQRASTIAVETSISSQGPTRTFYYQDEGHEFCVMIFPNRPAWVFDIATGEWHERAEGEAHWTAQVCAHVYGGFYICDVLGVVQKLTRNNTDVSGPLIRRATGRTFDDGGNVFSINRIQFLASVGTVGIGVAEPLLTLRMSKDRANTWPISRIEGLGLTGKYDTQLVFRSFGSFKAATAEIVVSDPYDLTIDAVGDVT